MGTSIEEREQLVVSSLEAAGEWRRKGDCRRELTALSGAATTLLGIAVEQFADASGGIRFLEKHEVGRAVDRIAELNTQLTSILHRDGKPTAGAVDNEITPVHVAWLLGRWHSGRSLAAQCLDEDVRKFFPLTAFWIEYHRAIDCLITSRPYEPVVPRTRSYERYWVPYLKLVADLTNGRPIVASRAEIADMFAKRNGDRRLLDWRMIDGDGKHPVRWDFREASILRFARDRQLITDWRAPCP